MENRLINIDRVWVGVFSAIFLGWIVLFFLAAGHPIGPVLGALSPAFDVSYWRAICLTSAGGNTFWNLFAMWGTMTLAMMLPTAVPTISAYRELTHNKTMAVAGIIGFIAGYILIWLVFAGLAAAFQQYLASAVLLSPHGISISKPLSAGLLIGAGLYQFSSLKASCLSECRSPMNFLLSRWRAGPAGAFKMGLHHGAVCVGCCWALMLLAFIGGAMNLIWMGGAMILMILEKFPDFGSTLTKPVGAVLIFAGLFVAMPL